jgi:hypothetical protein
VRSPKSGCEVCKQIVRRAYYLQPRYVLAGHYRLCERLPWDDVREKVTAEAGAYTGTTQELVWKAGRKFSTCPMCGKPWVIDHRPGRSIYYRPKDA